MEYLLYGDWLSGIAIVIVVIFGGWIYSKVKGIT